MTQFAIDESGSLPVVKQSWWALEKKYLPEHREKKRQRRGS